MDERDCKLHEALLKHNTDDLESLKRDLKGVPERLESLEENIKGTCAALTKNTDTLNGMFHRMGKTYQTREICILRSSQMEEKQKEVEEVFKELNNKIDAGKSWIIALLIGFLINLFFAWRF